MSKPTPTIGRIVQYTVNEPDAIVTNNLRRASHDYIWNSSADREQTGHQSHMGNSVEAGDVFPMLITRVNPDGSVNGQVFLDGNDTFWATSVHEGEGERHYRWPDLATGGYTGKGGDVIPAGIEGVRATPTVQLSEKDRRLLSDIARSRAAVTIA